jgi:DNA polymerase-3 subunit gamma/tau
MAKKAAAKTESAALTGVKDYTVLARRYRPQQFDDLVGQEAVVQALKNSIQTGRIAHAYLFTGVRGVGKTSIARILAKALNCVKGPTITPCDQCESCKAIAVGEDIDVLEIDGASNNKVEEVRELRQNTQYRPQSSRFKIYIIDEVHMLSNAAFNALLKTLEEPPPHVKFIFATTEVNKIPITILSRCQRYDLGGISREAIQKRLEEILEEEGQEADGAALHLIARRATGSMRDAQSLLDQALAFSQDKLTLERVQHLFGLAKEDQIFSIVKPVLDRNTVEALKALHDCLKRGVQTAELLDQWIELWRQLLLRTTLGDEAAKQDLFETDLKPLLAALSHWQPEAVMSGLDVLITTKTRLRFTSHGQVLMELAVIRLSRLADMLPLAEVAKRLDGLAKGASRSRPVPTASRITSEPGLTAKPPQPTVESFRVSINGEIKSTAVENQSLDRLPELWQAVLNAFAANSPHRAMLEKSTAQRAVPPNGLLVSFPRNCQDAKEFNAESSRCLRLEEVLKKLTGQTILARFELAQEEFAPERHVPKAQMMKQTLQQVPLARALMEQLGAQVVDMDEGFGAVLDNSLIRVE